MKFIVNMDILIKNVKLEELNTKFVSVAFSIQALKKI